MDRSDEALLKDVNYFATSLISAFTIFTSWRTAKLSYAIYQKKKNIKTLQTSQVYAVDELKGKELKGKDVVIVKGSVGTADGKEVERSIGWGKTQKLAIQLKFREAIYSNDSFDLKKNNYVLNMKEALKSCTIDGSNRLTLQSGKTKESSSILLKNFDKYDYSKVMEVLSWEEKKRDLTLAEHINIILLGILRALIMAGSEGKDGGYIRGLQIGKREVEAGLKVGASISILGGIGFTVDGEMILEVHQIFKDRLSEIQGLNEQIESLMKKRNFWLLGSVLGCIYLGRRVYKYIKEKNIKIPIINP